MKTMPGYRTLSGRVMVLMPSIPGPMGRAEEYRAVGAAQFTTQCTVPPRQGSVRQPREARFANPQRHRRND